MDNLVRLVMSKKLVRAKDAIVKLQTNFSP